MNREEAYAWVKRTGAMVNFAARDKAGQPAVQVQLESETGLGAEIEDAITELKTKVQERVKKHLAKIE